MPLRPYNLHEFTLTFDRLRFVEDKMNDLLAQGFETINVIWQMNSVIIVTRRVGADIRNPFEV